MTLSYEFAIALRYLKTKRHGFFAMITTILAVSGIALGVAAMIVTLAVMSGFRLDLQEKILGIQPHVILFGGEDDSAMEIESLTAKIKNLPSVESVAPFILGQTLVKSAKNSQGIVLRGIVPEKEFSVTEARKTLIAGSWDSLSYSDESRRSLVLGKELARNLAVTVDDEILVFSPTESASLGAMGSIPKIEKFKVGGIFQSGMYDYDANLAFISLSQAQTLFGITGVTALGVRTSDLYAAEETSFQIGGLGGSRHWSRSWQAMNRNLFEALKLEKIMMSVILTMITLVASFTIISNLILMSIEKTRDIGILRAIGASRKSIEKIFLYAGMSLGTAGIVLGTVLGIATVKVLSETQWIKLPQDVYYIDTLPARISVADIGIVLLAAFLITVVSAVYPARKASRIDPVDAIRYG